METSGGNGRAGEEEWGTIQRETLSSAAARAHQGPGTSPLSLRHP